jgi:sporulation integral membrane protein YtvI
MNRIVKCKVLVCAVLRGGKAIAPGGGFVLQEGDRIFVTASTNDLATLLKNIGVITRKVSRAILCGGGSVSYYLAQQLQRILSELVSKITGVVTALLRRLPGVLFFLTVTLIACIYFALDHDKVCGVLERLVPSGWRTHLPRWKRRFSHAFKRCARAYLLLFLLTFAELFFGFLLLRIPYPFLLGVAISLLDVLPVLGVGTVLIPWGIFALLAGNTGRGVGLLVLYGVMSVIRQIAEPHLLGKSIGLHPIVMLIAFYVGLSLFGMVGILIGPGVALLCKLLFDRTRGEEV